MRNLTPALTACALTVASAATVLSFPQGSAPRLLRDARQLILVTTPDWDAVRGELRRFDRASSGARWIAAGAPVAIVVGRAGLAWDPLADAVVAGPQKREGDGRAPAGVFSLGAAFGHASPPEAAWLKLPYLHVTEGLECVDDAASSRYNQIVDRRRITSPDWNSSEKMRDIGEPYRWGVVINYNTPAVATRGSCIFLHIGGGEGSKGTAGCTAMPAADLRPVMQWLDATANPVIVQLPRAAYEKLNAEWQLP